MLKIAQTLTDSRAFMKRQREQAFQDMGRVVDPPVEIVGTCVFKENTPTPMDDAVTIKQFNGATYNYCSWKLRHAMWQFNRFNQYGFNYVARVCE